MAWMLDFYKLNYYYQYFLRRLSCCDLCSTNIIETSLFDNKLSQALLCQNCLDELPQFNQQLLFGNLLNWPAINHALPKISFDQLFSLSPYIYPFNHWLAQLKYSGRFELADLFSTLLCAQWQSIMIKNTYPPVDLVIPVPLHLKKWQHRGYNQAHLIAKKFAEQLAFPYDANLLVRVKNNDSQMGKTGVERRRNLKNSFAFKKNLASDIKHIIIVDDVVTTGTTASEMSKLLKSVGVETITLVTVCLSLPKSIQ